MRRSQAAAIGAGEPEARGAWSILLQIAWGNCLEVQAVQALLVSATHFPVKWVFTGNFWKIAKFTHLLAAQRAQKLAIFDT